MRVRTVGRREHFLDRNWSFLGASRSRPLGFYSSIHKTLYIHELTIHALFSSQIDTTTHAWVAGAAGAVSLDIWRA